MLGDVTVFFLRLKFNVLGYCCFTFPAKNKELRPLKNCASARHTATHQEKREFSSDDKLPNKRRKRRRNKSSHASRSASQHTQGCGNPMPDLSDTGNFDDGQVEFSC